MSKEGRKLVGILVILAIVVVVMNPGLWIISIGSLIHGIIVYVVADLICRAIFKKSLRNYIFGK